MTMNGKGPSEAMDDMLGYTLPLLADHIEKQFTKGMDWLAFCNGDIHISPVASFDLSEFQQLESCYSLANLRPAWAKDNIEKRDKCLYLV